MELAAKTKDVVRSDTGTTIQPSKTFADCADPVDILFVAAEVRALWLLSTNNPERSAMIRLGRFQTSLLNLVRGGRAARGRSGLNRNFRRTSSGEPGLTVPDSFLLGYTNGYFACFPTIAAAVRGGYGANSTVNPTEVGSGEQMLTTGLISIYELLGRLSERPGIAR